MANYAIQVHSLKSDAKYFGFETLAELAYKHEMESKANNMYFVTDNYEFYLLIKDEKAKQQDPIYCLVDVEDDFEFARTLTWERNDNSWEKSPEPQ